MAYSFNHMFFEDKYRTENPPIQLMRDVFHPKTRGTDTLTAEADDQGLVPMRGGGGFNSLLLILQLSEHHNTDPHDIG